jgi:hypothetical protein
MTNYGDLSRSEIEQRLQAAEDVCVAFGWCGTRDDTDREQAAEELWHRWARLVGSDFTGPAAHPELAASEQALAEERRTSHRQLLSDLVDRGIVEIVRGGPA